MDVRYLLAGILIAEILQVPQVQKFMSWLWVQFRFYGKRSGRFFSRWSRRAYYWGKSWIS